MENPALAKRGVPNTDQAGGSIYSEYATALLNLQAVHLARRSAMSIDMAKIVARVQWEARQ